MSEGGYLLLADVVLVMHFAVTAYIVLGLPVIWAGRWFGAGFVRNPWFRYSHAGLMGVVLAESLAGVFCPLTEWETRLRQAADAGFAGDGQGFVARWVGRVLFHDLGETAFTVIYGLFFAAVALTLWLVPVRRPMRGGRENPSARQGTEKENLSG